jgi:hypothetical protein
MGSRDWGSLSLSIAKGPAKLKAGGPKRSDWGYTVYDVCWSFLTILGMFQIWVRRVHITKNHWFIIPVTLRCEVIVMCPDIWAGRGIQRATYYTHDEPRWYIIDKWWWIHWYMITYNFGWYIYIYMCVCVNLPLLSRWKNILYTPYPLKNMKVRLDHHPSHWGK